MRRDGAWLETKPEPGTVMINIGDMMQRWTADKFISNVWDVVILMHIE